MSLGWPRQGERRAWLAKALLPKDAVEAVRWGIVAHGLEWRPHVPSTSLTGCLDKLNEDGLSLVRLARRAFGPSDLSHQWPPSVASGK